MARKEDNLVNFTSEQSREEAAKNGRKGGINSGKARRDKRKMKEILTELLEMKVKDAPQFAEIASKLGIECEKNVKELFILICLLNSLEKGNLYDIEKLMELVGEDSGHSNGILENILTAVQNIDNG